MSGVLTLGQSVKLLRKSVALTQKIYAVTVAKVSVTQLDLIEKDNLTLETLNNIGKPFGLALGFTARPR